MNFETSDYIINDFPRDGLFEGSQFKQRVLLKMLLSGVNTFSAAGISPVNK